MSDRRKLTNRRATTTQKVVIGDAKAYVSTSKFEDGALAEIFVTLHREGSAFRGLMSTFAIIVSIALQHGVPARVLADAMRGVDFEPNGMVNGDERFSTCTSIIDYLAQVIEAESGRPV